MSLAEPWKWHPPAGVALFTAADGSVWVSDGIRCVRLDSGALPAILEARPGTAELLADADAFWLSAFVERVRGAPACPPADGLCVPSPETRFWGWSDPVQADATLILTSLPGARLEHVRASEKSSGVDCARVLVGEVMVGLAMAQRVTP